MIRVILADIVKLRRPLTLWLTLVMMGVSVLFAFMSHTQADNSLYWAQQQVTQAEQTIAEGGTPPMMIEEAQQTPEERRLAAENDLQFARENLSQVKKDIRLSVATQGPLGALGIALGMLCSFAGAFMLVVAAGGHVAGEWAGLTIKETLIADRRRGVMIGAKIVSLFLLAIWLLVASWVGVTIWGLISKKVYPVGGAATASEVMAWVGPMLWKAPLTILFFAALATLLAVAIRNSVGTLFAGIAAVAAIVVTMMFVRAARFSPGAWVASWMDYQPHQSLVDHLWFSKLVASEDPESVVKIWPFHTNALALGVLTVVLIAAAVVVMRRRDALS